MVVHDFNAQRLYVDTSLAGGEVFVCSTEQAHYLNTVLRLGVGDRIRVFNGREGEWLCEVNGVAKQRCELGVLAQTRPQEAGPDIGYYFAPLKRPRSDYVIQKATELGVARLQPVITQRTIARHVSTAWMRPNVIEAAEQCGILRLPEVREPVKLTVFLEHYSANRHLIMCDESAPIASPLRALENLGAGACDVLIGPEGGFAEEERAWLLGHGQVTAISLGPRIMRADTAGVAALALLNSVIGDWR